MNGRWRVYRARRKDGGLYDRMVAWDATDPMGLVSTFESWHEAMEWATSIVPHVEWWLECETRRRAR